MAMLGEYPSIILAHLLTLRAILAPLAPEFKTTPAREQAPQA